MTTTKQFPRFHVLSGLVCLTTLFSVQSVSLAAIINPTGDTASASSATPSGKLSPAIEAALVLDKAALLMAEPSSEPAIARPLDMVPPSQEATIKPASTSNNAKPLQDELRAAFTQEFVQSIRYNPAKTVLPADADILDEPWKVASNSGLIFNEDGMVVPHAIEGMPSMETSPADPKKSLAKKNLDELGESLQTFLRFLQPVQNALVSSPFGFRWGRPHQGIDLAAPMGSSIVAAESGRVIYSGWKQGYGNFVAIDHGHGMVTHYAHCSRLLAHTGNRVKKGAIIAKVGNSGHSTGPHLHFEVVANGVHKNPVQYLNHTISLVAR